jgi:hypothetical protein
MGKLTLAPILPLVFSVAILRVRLNAFRDQTLPHAGLFPAHKDKCAESVRLLPVRDNLWIKQAAVLSSAVALALCGAPLACAQDAVSLHIALRDHRFAPPN